MTPDSYFPQERAGSTHETRTTWFGRDVEVVGKENRTFCLKPFTIVIPIPQC